MISKILEFWREYRSEIVGMVLLIGGLGMAVFGYLWGYYLVHLLGVLCFCGLIWACFYPVFVTIISDDRSGEEAAQRSPGLRPPPVRHDSWCDD